MNLLHALTALHPALRQRAEPAECHRVLGQAWEGVERILADPRFLSLRELLGVRDEAAARRLRDELSSLRAASYELPGQAPTSLDALLFLLQGNGYPATAAMLRREHPLLIELAGALLGDPQLQPLVNELRRVEAEERKEASPPLAEPDQFEIDLDAGGDDQESGSQVAALDDDEDIDDAAETARATGPARPGSPMPTTTPAPRRDEMPAPRRAATPEGAVRSRASVTEADEEDEEATFRRRASVRWFKRMNPLRMYPLHVVLAQGRLRETLRPGQTQAVGKEQLVVKKDDPFLRIRPVLPGCTVYPDEQVVDATPAQVNVRFQVVPQTLGKLDDARVEIYQAHRLLTTIELPIVVSRQTGAVVLASLGLAWPVLGTLVKNATGDGAEPQDMLMRGITWAMAQPHAMELGLGIGAVAAAIWWWWNRPTESSRVAGLDQLQPMSVAELLQAAKVALLRGDKAEARSCAEDALNLDPKNSIAADLLARCQ